MIIKMRSVLKMATHNKINPTVSILRENCWKTASGREFLVKKEKEDKLSNKNQGEVWDNQNQNQKNFLPKRFEKK